MNRKLLTTLMIFLFSLAFADETTWLSIGMLQNWFSSTGNEIEVGRTHETRDQQDGHIWPGLYEVQDMQCQKALWVATKNYADPLKNNDVYSAKIAHNGPRLLDEEAEFMPVKFVTYGKFDHPKVLVDNSTGTIMKTRDQNVVVDPTIPSDRLIHNVVNTSVGVTVTRKIYAYSNPYHDNYFIFEYVFKNTGIYNQTGDRHNLTLEDVIFHFQWRYGISKYMGAYGNNYAPQDATWGSNTVHHHLHTSLGDPYRGFYAYHGLHSDYKDGVDNIGAPDNKTGSGFLGGSQIPGVVTIHADTGPGNQTDDTSQPAHLQYFSNDDDVMTKQQDQFNGPKMEPEYAGLSAGSPEKTHEDFIGVGNDANLKRSGYTQSIGYGPYTLAPGDSIRIVQAECADGLSWEMRKIIGDKWINQITPYTLPDGTDAANRDEFKNAWVFTGIDSLYRTFDKAITTVDNDFVVPSPPPPPASFKVVGGGDRISLTWTNESEIDNPHFGGYRVYRQIHTPDTTFDLIYECGAGTDNPEITYMYEDFSAVRGFDYYYYITAFDDGLVDPDEKLLESSLFWTRTSRPATLKREPGKALDGIRVVPNPYHIGARDYQFGESAPDRIMFYNIPPECKIRIFTERGDLIKTINHTDKSGDEPWNCITKYRQVVVSGVYIAHIEVTADFVDDKTGEVYFRKGDNKILKFIVIR